jgi:hypothetical protein
LKHDASVYHNTVVSVFYVAQKYYVNHTCKLKLSNACLILCLYVKLYPSILKYVLPTYEIFYKSRPCLSMLGCRIPRHFSCKSSWLSSPFLLKCNVCLNELDLVQGHRLIVWELCFYCISTGLRRKWTALDY